MQEPEPVGERIDALPRRHEVFWRDLDHREVVPAGAEIEQRRDRPLVEER